MRIFQAMMKDAINSCSKVPGRRLHIQFGSLGGIFLFFGDVFFSSMSHLFRIKWKCLSGKPVDVGPKEENPSEERVLEAGDGWIHCIPQSKLSS